MNIKMNIGKSNFLDAKLETICSNDDLRPAMQCVYFKDGYVYATDAHVAIKQHLSLHDIDEECAKILDGKLLHKSHLQIMKKCDWFEILPNGIKSKKGMMTITHEFYDDKYPDIEKVIPKKANSSLNVLGLNAVLLKKVQDVMFQTEGQHLKLEFTKPNGAILLTTMIRPEHQVGLIMPIHVTKD